MTSELAKPKSTNRRCYHFTPTGRRCRSGIRDEGGLYCPRHTDDLSIRAGDFSELLTEQAGRFDAQGIHGSLAMLYHVAASGDISPRRAAVLTYMSSLMLRTLPMIEINLQNQCAEMKARIASAHPGAVIRSSVDPASNSITIDFDPPIGFPRTSDNSKQQNEHSETQQAEKTADPSPAEKPRFAEANKFGMIDFWRGREVAGNEAPGDKVAGNEAPSEAVAG